MSKNYAAYQLKMGLTADPETFNNLKEFIKTFIIANMKTDIQSSLQQVAIKELENQLKERNPALFRDESKLKGAISLALLMQTSRRSREMQKNKIRFLQDQALLARQAPKETDPVRPLARPDVVLQIQSKSVSKEKGDNPNAIVATMSMPTPAPTPTPPPPTESPQHETRAVFVKIEPQSSILPVIDVDDSESDCSQSAQTAGQALEPEGTSPPCSEVEVDELLSDSEEESATLLESQGRSESVEYEEPGEYDLVLHFLKNCTPPMDKFYYAFVQYGCTSSEYLVAASTWPVDKVDRFLRNIARQTGVRMSEMDIEVLQHHLSNYP